MKYVDILPFLQKMKVFSHYDLKLIDPAFDASKITRWKKKGLVVPLIRGYYALGEKVQDTFLPYFTANCIYSPSYISLETALHQYGIIPEFPFTITSVGTRKTIHFSTSFGNFSYASIKSDLFWGYEVQDMQGYKILFATPEKAILDFFYLRTDYKTLEDLEGLRWNKVQLKEKLNRKLLISYASSIGSKRLEQKIHLLFDYIEHDDVSQY